MKTYVIDYGSDHAELVTSTVGVSNVLDEFYKLATQCFGVRKSITKDPKILESREEGFPSWVSSDAHVLLRTCVRTIPDTIIWDKSGTKLKSEWD